MGADYSRQDMSFALRLANRGFDRQQIARAIATKPSGKRDPGSVKFWRVWQERGKDAADRYADRTARKAVEFVRANPPVRGRWDTIARLIRIRRAVDRFDWSRRPAPRKALEAILRVALRLPTMTIGFSLRQWAEEAGQDLTALRRARGRLIAYRFLSIAPGRTSRGSLRYSLHLPPDTVVPPCEKDCVTSGRGDSVTYDCAALPWTPELTHDAWRPAAFGDAGWVGELARCTPPCVPRPGWSRSEMALEFLDRIAAEAGTLGEGARDRARHADERAEFRMRRSATVDFIPDPGESPNGHQRSGEASIDRAIGRLRRVFGDEGVIEVEEAS